MKYRGKKDEPISIRFAISDCEELNNLANKLSISKCDLVRLAVQQKMAEWKATGRIILAVNSNPSLDRKSPLIQALQFNLKEVPGK